MTLIVEERTRSDSDATPSLVRSATRFGALQLVPYEQASSGPKRRVVSQFEFQLRV
jgi:hypothetical protein